MFYLNLLSTIRPVTHEPGILVLLPPDTIKVTPLDSLKDDQESDKDFQRRDDHKVPPSAGLSLWTMIQGQSSPAPVLSSATTTPRGFRGRAALRGMSHGRRVGCSVLKQLQERLPKGVEH
uniref:Uncharacterized protein n=1 Tax=Timema cristinae TaxID=61476 RepID=A0A7R9D6M1_TIMCR|nr:unnamed protein product [Timema cristinae]